jgi:hypothetical protein
MVRWRLMSGTVLMVGVVGDPSTGRPARLQGIFWMAGWHWMARRGYLPSPCSMGSCLNISVSAWRTQTWGYSDTHPRKDKSKLFYLPSGAAFLNGGVWLGPRYDIYYNEVLPLPGLPVSPFPTLRHYPGAYEALSFMRNYIVEWK